YNGQWAVGAVRLSTDGGRLTGFGEKLGLNGTINSIAPVADSSGDIWVGGTFTNYSTTSRNGIARLNSDGTPDASFDPGSGFNGSVNHVAAASDGSGDIYVAASATTY